MNQVLKRNNTDGWIIRNISTKALWKQKKHIVPNASDTCMIHGWCVILCLDLIPEPKKSVRKWKTIKILENQLVAGHGRIVRSWRSWPKKGGGLQGC